MVSLICLSFASGISLKTQELYVLVFLTRYLDLFTRYVSFYNSIMKLVFIGTSIAIVWYMRYHKVVKQTYNMDEDTFKQYLLILLSFVLALLIPHEFTTIEVCNIAVIFFLCLIQCICLLKKFTYFIYAKELLLIDKCYNS